MAVIKIKVIPGASKSEIVGMWQDMLKVKVTSPPQYGKANDACLELLAKRLKVPKNRIRIVRGFTKRYKVIEITGLPDEALSSKIIS